MNADSIIELAALLAAIVAIGVAVWKILGTLRTLIKVVNKVDEAIPRLLDVADNWSYNGGYTLRDRLERTERNVEKIGEHLGIPIDKHPERAKDT